MLKTDYMYKNKWTDEFNSLYNNDYQAKDEPYYVRINNGIILPTKYSPGQVWGLGD